MTDQSLPATQGLAGSRYEPDSRLAHLNPMSKTEEGLLWFRQQDYQRARAAWEQAAQSGNPGGLYGLGMLHEAGLGRPANIDQTVEYYQRAAVAGHDQAGQALLRLQSTGRQAAKVNPSGRKITFLAVAVWKAKVAKGLEKAPTRQPSWLNCAMPAVRKIMRPSLSESPAKNHLGTMKPMWVTPLLLPDWCGYT